MISLFLDACGNNRIISIVKDEEMIYYFNEKNDTNLSNQIMVELEKAFFNCNLKPQDIDKIYIVTGPGSFTGIRVGVTIAKIMGMSLSIPLIQISELELMASGQASKAIVPILDARRGYVFGAIYDENLDIIFKDSYILWEELQKNLPKEHMVIENANKIDIIKLIKKHQTDEPISYHELKPNYLKKTEAEENLQ